MLMIMDSIGSTSSSSISFVDISIFWDVVDPAVIVKGLWVIEYSSCFAEPDTANGMVTVSYTHLRAHET